MINTAAIRLTIEGYEPNQSYPDLLKAIARRVIRKEITSEEAVVHSANASVAYDEALKAIATKRFTVTH